MAQQPGGFGGWFAGFPGRVQAWTVQQDARLREMRERAEQNPGDLNTIGFPDWATGSSIREKKIARAILTGMEKKTGRDLSAFKED